MTVLGSSTNAPRSQPSSPERSAPRKCGSMSFGCLKMEPEIGGYASALRRRSHHAVAAVVLGAVERDVGALQHVADRLALELKGRQPDRDRDLDARCPLVDRKRFA